MRSPKPKKITPAQEAELEKIEATLARVRILQYGVQKILDDGEYCDSLGICAQVLTEANDMRRAAYRQRNSIFSHAEDRSPNRAR